MLLIFGLNVNCMLTASIWFTDFFVRFSLPSAYYEIKGFEKSGRLYERLGVRAARRVFRYSPAVRFSGQRAALPKLESDMRLAETHHVLSLAIIVLISIGMLVMGQRSLALCLLIFGVAVQVYPIILQRYNRRRFLRVWKVMSRHVTSAA